MLRGIRWQVLAFFLAALLFVAALVFRNDGTPTSDLTDSRLPTSPAQPTAEVLLATTAPITTVSTVEQPSGLPNNLYREALIGSIQRINPLLASLNPVDRDIASLIFEGLTRLNEYGEPVPGLAERWVISNDGLEYIFYLRQDIQWQDGESFTAADVIYTMSLLRDPRFPGAPELGAFWRTVETEQLGDYLVRFRLAQPLGAFLDRLTIGILPEHVLRGTGAAQIATHPFNLAPIGTGPYQLMRIVAPDGVTPRAVELAAAPVYHQRPEGQAQPFAIQHITFVLYNDFPTASEALSRGEVDGLATRDREERAPLFSLALNNQVSLYNSVEPTVGMLIYNWARESTPFFKEQRVRLALETGLDRNGAVERALPNLAVRTDSPLIPGSWAYLPSLAMPAYDPVSARQLLVTAADRLQRLAEANQTPTPEGQPTQDSSVLFTFSILTPNTTSLMSMANEIATQWSQLGVNVTVDAVDVQLYEARLRSHDFDAAMVEFGMSGSGDPDVYGFWHEGQYPDGANYGGVSDRMISEILERARREPYNINRIPEYRQFQEDFVDRAIALPIYNPLFTYAMSSAVRGVQLGFLSTPASRFDSIGEWTISR